MAKVITLSKGLVTEVDDSDFGMLSQYKWYADSFPRTSYAASRVVRNMGFRFMHRFLLGATDPDLHVDHIDGNGLNNQRSNLRLVTKAQNNRNRRAQLGNSSGYRGVSLHANRKAWVANIWTDSRLVYLGYFASKEEAAEAYNRAAVKAYGEYARLNEVNNDGVEIRPDQEDGNHPSER